MTLVDSHCHLDLVDLALYGHDFDRMLQASKDQGVNYFLCVGLNFKHTAHIMGQYAHYDCIALSAGLHPTEDLDEAWADQPKLFLDHQLEKEYETLLALARHPRVMAIGETGLDFYRTSSAFCQNLQKERLRYHIAIARHLKKPLIIHSRHAPFETVALLKQESAQDIGGVLHCFTEDWPMAKAAMEMGFYISFSGILTFKNAQALQAVAAKIPADRLLVETDAPYLAPVPYRGKPNMPGYTVYVAQKLAALRGELFETIAQQTTQNFFRLFFREG